MAGATNGAPRSAVGRVLVLGYYDGATDGVMEFGEAVYRFDPADEGDLVPDVVVRRYTLRPVPADALDRLAAALALLGPATWPVWCPRWQFPTADDQRAAEAAVDAILAESGRQ